MSVRRFTGTTMWPDTCYVKLKYRTYYHQTTSVANNAVVYRGNSVFDPQYAVGGTQPEGFDQWATQYQEYYVSASKIRVIINNPGTGSLLRHSIIPCPVDNVTTLSDTTGTLRPEAFPYCKTKYTGNPGGSKTLTWLKHYMTTRKMIRRDVKDVDLSADVTANPGEEWMWVFRTDYYDNTQATASCHLDIQITYYVLFHKRKYPIDV